MSDIHGSGGGGKGGGGGARTPVESPDSLHNTAFAAVLDVIANGETAGPAHPDAPMRDIYLNGTPIQNPDGTLNFSDVQVDYRVGTVNQTHIPGFPASANVTQVGSEIRTNMPWVQALTNPNLSAVRVSIHVPNLLRTIDSGEKAGDRVGYRVEYAVDLAVSGGAFKQILKARFDGKTVNGYTRTHRIDLPAEATIWTVRVRRLTPESNNSTIADKIYLQTYAEVIDGKFTYPMTALVGIRINAEQFQSIPTRAYHWRGQIIRVPSNYNPVTRKYFGTWDGTFKRAWSNNPAWVYYDMLTNRLYGLGDRINAAMIDRYALYQIGAYCDQLVPDGMGGQEPRFVCNVYLQAQADALRILNDLSSVFRGMAYWANGQVVAVADMPSDPVYTYTNANVIDGRFEYTGADLSTLKTVALVSWSDPSDFYRAKVEVVEDGEGIRRYGIRKTQIVAFGCTSRGQAQRVGLYHLYTSRMETGGLTFSVGLDGVIPQPGSLVKIADRNRAGRHIGGRIVAASSNRKSITLDRDHPVKVGDTLTVNLPNGKTQSRPVTALTGARIVTVSPAFTVRPAPESVWAVDAADLVTQHARVIAVKERDGITFDVSAVLHHPGKFAAIDSNVRLDPLPVSVAPPRAQLAPSNIQITPHHVISQGIARHAVEITWDAPEHAVLYDVQWRRDNGDWVQMPRTGTRTVELSDVFSGTYVVRVRAVNSLDVPSLWAYSDATEVSGTVGAPPALVSLATTGEVMAIRLDWAYPITPNIIERVQIRASLNNAFNDSYDLTELAYPTRTHTVYGLGYSTEMWFWVRLIDKNGEAGPWYPSENGAGVSGQPTQDAGDLLDYMEGKVGESHFVPGLIDEIKTDINIDVDGKLDGINTTIDNAIEGVNSKIDTAISGVNDNLNTAIGGVNTSISEIEGRLDNVPTDIEKNLIGHLTGDDGNAPESVLWFAGDDGSKETFVGTVSQTSAINEGDYTLAKSIEVVAARTGDNEAYIGRVDAARADGDSALAQSISSLSATVGQNTAKINDEQTARADADSALAQDITSLNATVGQNTAAIATEATARAAGDQANATLIQGVKSQLEGDVAAVNTKADTAVSASSANAGQIQTVLTRMPAGNGTLATQAAVQDEANARTSADSALASQVQTVQAQLGDKASASALSQVNVRVEGLEQAGYGSNLLTNASFESGAKGWLALQYASTWGPLTLDLGGDNAHPPGMHSLGIECIGTLTEDQRGTILCVDVPVIPGKKYMASCYIANQRCDAQLTLAWRKADKSIISSLGSAKFGPANGGQSIVGWHYAKRSGPAPDDAAYARLTVRFIGNGGANPKGWILRPMLEEAREGQTQPSPWNAGGMETRAGLLAEVQRTDALLARMPDGTDKLARQAAVITEEAARLSGDQANATALNAAKAQLQDNIAAVQSTANAAVSQGSANAGQITALNATVGQHTAQIAQEQTARAAGDQANATLIQGVKSQLEGDVAAVNTKADTAVSASSANAQQIETVQAALGGKASAAALSQVNTRVEGLEKAGYGSNLLTNASFESGVLKWFGQSQGPGWSQPTIDLAGDDYHPPGIHNIGIRCINQTLTDGNHFGQVYSAQVPVVPGQKFIASCLIANFRCKARLYLMWRSADAWLSGVNTPDIARSSGSLKNLANWHHASVSGVAPADAAYAQIVIRFLGDGGENPFGWIIRPMLEAARENQTEPSPWNMGGAETRAGLLAEVSRIDTLVSQLGDTNAAVQQTSTALTNLKTGAEAQWGVKAQVRAADGKTVITGMQMGAAVGADGTSRSEFLIRADTIGFLNTVDGSIHQPFVFDVPNNTAFLRSAFIKNASIDSAKIADGAIKSAQIADAAISSANIADAAITSAKIKDLAVDTGHFKDLSVTTMKLANGSVTAGTSVDYYFNFGGSWGENDISLPIHITEPGVLLVFASVRSGQNWTASSGHICTIFLDGIALETFRVPYFDDLATFTSLSNLSAGQHTVGIHLQRSNSDGRNYAGTLACLSWMK